MSFPRYRRYKNSGVTWLGDVPEEWQLSKLKYLVQFSGGGTPSREKPEYWSGSIPWVSPKDMKDERIDFSEEYITDIGLQNSSAALMPPGRVLLVVRSGILKHTIPVAINSVPVALNQDMKALHFEGDLCSPRFFLRWVQGLNNELLLEWAKQGATVESIEHSYLAHTTIALPSVDEQRAVVSFLDAEAAKIDSLVEEQERLITLLNEKRQAIVVHAVTTGLNPGVPMKESGVEWLGRIPAHWEVVQSRRLFTVRSERTREGDQQLTASQKYGIILQSDFVALEGRRVVEVILGTASLLHIEPNDFVISMRSFQGGIEWCQLRGSISFHYVVLVPEKHVHGPFFAHLFKSVTYIQALRTTTDLIRDGQEIRYSNFVQVPLPIVPIEEQRAIAEFLGGETAKIDALLAEAERGIALLRERRAALISAAVTGKIDVRGFGSADATPKRVAAA